MVLFGDFNHKADNAFQHYKRFYPPWTFLGVSRTTTDMFLLRSNVPGLQPPLLEEFSNDSTFATSDHRLMALRLRVPFNSTRLTVSIPKAKDRLNEMEKLLKQTRDPREFFGNLTSPKTELFRCPIHPSGLPRK